MTPEKFNQAYQQGLNALDSQLGRAKRELTTLAAARPADPDVISTAVLRAQQASESLGSLLAEAASVVGDPPPLWTTREEFEAIAARVQKKLEASVGGARRTRLQAIANSLLVAQVLHPRWKKVVPALDALRLHAVTQLQAAARSAEPPDLPGPADGGGWLAWAWELPTEEVEASLASVKATIPALVEVVLEIDPGHWVVVADVNAMPPIAEAIAMPESGIATKPDSNSDEVRIAEAAPVAEAASSILSGFDPVPIAAEVSMPSGTVRPSESWLGENSSPRLFPNANLSNDGSSVLPAPRKPKNNLPELPPT